AARGASAGARYGRIRGALVTAQVGLALVLLLGAFVLATTVHRLRNVDLGVETSGVLTFELNLPGGRYDADARALFHREMTRRLATLPGVTHAAATSRLPATGGYHSWGTWPQTGPRAGDDDAMVSAQQRVVAGDYFAALDIELLEGRIFDERDGADSAPVAVLGRAAARELFPGTSALGQRTRAGGVERTVIGVVEDVALGPEGELAPYQYHAHAQFADNRNWSLTYVVATDGDAAALTPTVRRDVAAVDPQLVVHRPAMFDDVLGRGRSQRRFAFVLTAVFAALALTLAIVGLYGVLAYGVSQRTREIGIRLALGAEPRRVAGGVMRQGLLLAAAGLVPGIIGALALGRILASLVYRTDPADPRLIAAAAATLMLAAAVAAVVPTLRAMRVPPRIALAEE
ncbi:MAG: ABC transporter permease, partial [Longimicrobiales bacterium]